MWEVLVHYYYVERGTEYSIGGEKDSTEQIDIEFKSNNTCNFYYNRKFYSGSWHCAKYRVYVNIPGLFDTYGTAKNGVLQLHDCPKNGYDVVFYLDGTTIRPEDIPHIYKPSSVEIAFNEARNMNRGDCSPDVGGRYTYSSPVYYDDVELLSDDCVTYHGKLILLSYSALYNAFSVYTQVMYNNPSLEPPYATKHLSSIVGTIGGETKDQKQQMISKAAPYLIPNIDSNDLLLLLTKSGVVSDLKESSEKTTYSIDDFNAATETLGITGRMLGYMISHIGGAAEFDENSVHMTIYKH